MSAINSTSLTIQGINITILECKSVLCSSSPGINNCINITILECKFFLASLSSLYFYSINITILECKFTY